MSQTLKQKRLSVGLTQLQVAQKDGITERGYRKYEASNIAKTKSIPDVVTAIKIADTLGVKNLRQLWSIDESESEVI